MMLQVSEPQVCVEGNTMENKESIKKNGIMN